MISVKHDEETSIETVTNKLDQILQVITLPHILEKLIQYDLNLFASIDMAKLVAFLFGQDWLNIQDYIQCK